jgi:hypothetical protein
MNKIQNRTLKIKKKEFTPYTIGVKPGVSTLFDNSSTMNPMQGQLNPVKNSTSYIFKIYINIIPLSTHFFHFMFSIYVFIQNFCAHFTFLNMRGTATAILTALTLPS